MQAVILAAGQSSRFWPLNKQHKSLFKIKGYPLICHTINSLKKYGVKNIIIVQAKKRDIEKELKNYDLKTDIQYVIQPEPKGTGDALFRAKKIVKDDFIILVGPHKIDLENHISLLLKKFNANKNKIVLLGAKTTKPWNFGILRFKGKKIEKIEENPGKGKDLLAVKATETYILPVGFFDYYKKVKKKRSKLDRCN